jgi:hypothetical protein
MDLRSKKEAFDRERIERESFLLTFNGTSGYDIYNCSIPFMWKEKEYIFGRMEKRGDWARSWVRLFEKSGTDEYTLKKDSMIYQLEDPYVSIIHGELVLGGTHVRYRAGEIDTYYGYFYKGNELDDLNYFTTGPDNMKDIRLVGLAQGIGVFSRPRNDKVKEKYGSDSVVGFTIIPNIMSLTAEVVENAPIVEGLFQNGEWGGCNQCYLLDSGMIGVIAHKSYLVSDENGIMQNVYVNTSFVLDPNDNRLVDEKILATRSSYPDYPAKRPDLKDCAFTSGIVMRDDGKTDLYSGLGDTCEGRIIIDYPFEGFGKIV